MDPITHTLAGYRDLMSEGQLFLDSWMKIELRGKPIGYSHTAVEVADDDPQGEPDIAALAQAIDADRGTVRKQLARYRDRFTDGKKP